MRAARPFHPRRTVAVAVRAVTVLAVAAITIRIGAHNVHQLRHIHLQLHLGWLAVAVTWTIVTALLLPLSWRALVWAYGFNLAPRTAVRIWCLSQGARYLPTGLAGLASRVVLASRAGVTRAVGAASWLLEFGLLVLGGATIASAALPSSVLPGPIRFLAFVTASIALALFPVGIATASRASRRIPRLDSIQSNRFDTRRGYVATGLYVSNAMAKACGAVVVTAAFFPVGRGDIALLLGASAGAGVAGLVGITPAGIGVREAVLASILQPRFGLGDAAAIAVVLRAWDFGVELVWLAVAVAITRRVPPLTSGAGPSVDHSSFLDA